MEQISEEELKKKLDQIQKLTVEQVIQGVRVWIDDGKDSETFSIQKD